MSEASATLRRHKLAHVPVLQVDCGLFQKRFASQCRTDQCKAACCTGGVWVDVEERDRILKNAGHVRTMMDAGQEQDPARWFDAGDVADPDFPSGRAAGTQVVNGRCVFLDEAGRCTLQRAEAGGNVNLKPFFCRIFPLTLEYGVLTLDEMAADQTQCCAVSPTGPSTIFDVCAAELDQMLGPDGVEELRQLGTFRVERDCR